MATRLSVASISRSLNSNLIAETKGVDTVEWIIALVVVIIIFIAGYMAAPPDEDELQALEDSENEEGEE